jgi:putative oxidoreductase
MLNSQLEEEHMKGWNDGGALLGRILMSVIFLVAGLNKFSNMAGTQHFMAAMGMPRAIVPPLALIAATIEVLGGLSLILGFKVRYAAIILFLFLIPVTIVFHVIPDQPVHVMKNLAIMGGLLIVAAQGPGALSLDERRAS